MMNLFTKKFRQETVGRRGEEDDADDGDDKSEISEKISVVQSITHSRERPLCCEQNHQSGKKPNNRLTVAN